METITLIKLNSDNFENAYMSKAAYKELQLQMSTGDYHTHKAEEITVERPTLCPVDLGMSLEGGYIEFFNIDEEAQKEMNLPATVLWLYCEDGDNYSLLFG